jgi:hypothetical protein
MRDLIGAAVELAVGETLVPIRHGYGVGRSLDLGFEQARETSSGQLCGPGGIDAAIRRRRRPFVLDWRKISHNVAPIQDSFPIK